MSYIYPKKEIIEELVNINIIKYGNFVLKSGEHSEYYVDMKSLVSHPRLVTRIITNIYRNLVTKIGDNPNYKKEYVICGVPYGGIFFASVLSMISSIPMILLRNSTKDYGTKKLIEGDYVNKKIILIEDVITTGSSLIECIEKLNNFNIDNSFKSIEQIYVILDRDKNGKKNIFDYFISNNKQEPYIYTYLSIYDCLKLKDTKLMENCNYGLYSDNTAIEYNDNDNDYINKYTVKLKNIINEKTNICLSLDVPLWDKFFYTLSQVADKICMVKIHLDIMENLDTINLNRLSNLSINHNFMIWEDRKFCDIANTHKLQLKNLLKFNIDFVSINPSGGFKSIQPFFNKIGIFLLSELSCEDNLINEEYTNRCLEIANTNHRHITGIINQTIHRDFIHNNILSLTPGIHKYKTNDLMGQQYRNPKNLQHRPDIIIIGRAIYNSNIPNKMIDEFIK